MQHRLTASHELSRDKGWTKGTTIQQSRQRQRRIPVNGTEPAMSSGDNTATHRCITMRKRYHR
jgi:hypothetical protein